MIRFILMLTCDKAITIVFYMKRGKGLGIEKRNSNSSMKNQLLIKTRRNFRVKIYCLH